jgi:hypothetical protein
VRAVDVRTRSAETPVLPPELLIEAAPSEDTFARSEHPAQLPQSDRTPPKRGRPRGSPLQRALGCHVEFLQTRSPARYHEGHGTISFTPSRHATPEEVVSLLREHYSTVREKTCATFELERDPDLRLDLGVYLSGDRISASFPDEPSRKFFLELLAREDLDPRIHELLSPNAYFDREQKVARILSEKPRAVPMSSISTADAVLVPDVHGSIQPINAIRKLISSQRIDWLAMEMLGVEIQPALDTYLAEPKDSDAAGRARDQIKSYLMNHWGYVWAFAFSADDDPFLRLVDHAKQNHVRVVALECSYRKDFTPRLDAISMGTRNSLWADRMPSSGRGVVYGGLAHMASNTNVNVQHFLHANMSRTFAFLDWGLPEQSLSKSNDCFAFVRR